MSRFHGRFFRGRQSGKRSRQSHGASEKELHQRGTADIRPEGHEDGILRRRRGGSERERGSIPLHQSKRCLFPVHGHLAHRGEFLCQVEFHRHTAFVKRAVAGKLSLAASSRTTYAEQSPQYAAPYPLSRYSPQRYAVVSVSSS